MKNGVGAGPAKNEAGAEAVPGVGQQVVSAPLPTADVAELTATIQKLQAEKKELYDRLLRKQAELKNLRKRMEREKEGFRQIANAELIRDLLPSLDSIERALKHHDARVPEQFYNGVEMIYKGLFDVMKRHGLEPIDTVGRPLSCSNSISFPSAPGRSSSSSAASN